MIIISVLVGFVLIAMVIFGFQSKAEAKQKELLCKESIDWRAATTINAGGTDMRLMPPLCDTIDVEVTGSREEIKDQMAFLMSRCWYMFGEGKYEELLDNDIGGIRSVFAFDKVGNDCFLCYTAVIDQKKIDGGIISAKEMYDYLKDTDHRQIKGTTYLDYIQSNGGPGLAVVTDGIGAREAYGIVFMSKNKEMEGDSGWAYLATAAAGIGVTLCVASVICGGAVAVAGTIAAAATTLVASYGAYTQFKAEYYGGDRDVSAITFDHIKGIEAGGCAVRTLG